MDLGCNSSSIQSFLNYSLAGFEFFYFFPVCTLYDKLIDISLALVEFDVL